MRKTYMKAYKTYLTIQDPKHVVLSDVPFHIGQRVEVVLLAKEDNHINDLKAYYTSQKLPQAQTLTEEDIVAEVETYRRGR